MAALLAVAPPSELTGGELFPFRSTFKRHTPFALDFVENRIDGGSIDISRAGDVVMYVYLFSTEVSDWRYVVSSVDLIIGEQVIDTMPIEYIFDYAPILSGGSQAVAEYTNGASFLPLPIPRIPLCALRYHSVRIRLNGLTSSVRCQSCMAFLSDAERFDITQLDMLVNQVQKKPVCTDGTVYLSNPVKYLWSNTVSTTRLLINDADLCTKHPTIGL